MTAIVRIIIQTMRFHERTPFPGGFELNRPCRFGDRHKRIINLRTVELQGGYFFGGIMLNKKFKVNAPFNPTGDQPQAIDSLAEGIADGLNAQVLLGATGTGKTFTVAKVIERVQLPTLVIAHNKTLAAQLAAEFKSFFPDNYVGYFVSYYDYYQPEAYIAATDTYIEKDAAINDEIDQMRHSATCSLFERRDVIIVASVSCIYGLGSPENYS